MTQQPARDTLPTVKVYTKQVVTFFALYTFSDPAVYEATAREIEERISRKEYDSVSGNLGDSFEVLHVAVER